jgi:undecaprenyl-diphosphatase
MVSSQSLEEMLVVPLVQSWDETLFHLITGEGQNYFLDWFLPFMADLNHFKHVLVILGVWWLWKERKAGLIFLVFVGITLVISDQFSSTLLKGWVGRIRPCHAFQSVRLLADCNTSYSFPSSHAVNLFAAAFFLCQPYPSLSPLVYGIAAIGAYSRVYVGIHYPLDIIGGAAIGLLIAWPMRWLKDRAVFRLCPAPGMKTPKRA